MSNSEPILSEFLTKEELAAELRRNPRTLDRWDVLGVGPPRTHVGRQVLYRRASVERWLAAQEQRRRRSMSPPHAAIGGTDPAKNEADFPEARCAVASPCGRGLCGRGRVVTAAVPGLNGRGGTSSSLDFLDDFFGADKRHLVAIKKHKGKKPISRPTISTLLIAPGSKNLSPIAVPPASTFISARTRLRGRFTRRPQRATWPRHATFGSTLTRGERVA